MKGIIKTLLQDRKCGFIRVSGGKDRFFHQSALKNVKFDELAVGDEVEFEDTESDKGPRAEEIYV